MNPSEKVSSASPSPTNQSWYKAKRELSRRPSTFRHHHHRSRSYSASPPPPPPRSSFTKQRSPRGHTRPRTIARRSRSRSRRRSSPSCYRSAETDRVEQYLSICIKNLNDKIDHDHLYDSIYNEFKRYGQFTVKIVFNKKSGSHSRSERIAFVNFGDHRTALEAKRDKNHKVLCGLPMYIEPVYKNYSAGGQGQSRRSRSPGPPRGHHARRSASPRPYSRPRARDFAEYERRPSPYAKQRRVRTPPAPPARLKYDDLANRLSPKRSRSPRHRPPQPLMKSPAAPPQPPSAANSAMHYFDDDDKDQTRTLFIGNLDADTQKDFLWKQFERYGALEEIDIKKNLPPGHADYAKKTYAFVRYENMDMAKEAKMRMNAKRIGQSEIKIGYEKQKKSIIIICVLYL